MPNYATGAIPKKHTNVKTDSCKKPCTQGMDQRLQHDEAERCHDSVQTPGTSAAGKSHKEQKELKTIKPPSPDEPAAHSTGSEVDSIEPQRDLSSTKGLQGGPQMSAVSVKGENNTTIVVSGSPGAQIFIPPKTDTAQRQPCSEGNEMKSGSSENSGTKSGELNVNTETNALDIETNSEAASRAAQRCKDELKIKYMTTGRYVQTVPGVENAKRDIKEIYTNLQYTHGETKSSGYNFITTRELGIKRIVIAGKAGSGKSTLLCKIAYDWATGEKTLSKYELVFLLKMQSLDESSQLIDAISDKVLDYDTGVILPDLQTFISENPDEVLILLDGFNELKTSNLYDDISGSILQLLNRKIGRECCVITTTRPSHMKDLVHESLIQKPYTRIDVVGFASEDIEKYVKGFFHEQHDKAQKLLLRIKSQDVLSGMATFPMFLLLMCLLWGEKSELPETMAKLYETAMVNLFQRKSKKVASKSIPEVLTKIGEIALRGLLGPELMSSFEEAEFESSEAAMNVAMTAGVFTSKEVITCAQVRTRIEFIHRTIQEYCAALYIQSLTSKPDIFQQTLQRIKSLTKDNHISFEYLFRFCCVKPECMRAVLEVLQDCQDPRLALQCYFDSQSDELPPAYFINSVICESINISSWNSDCIKSFMHFLEQVADQKKVQDNIYLQKVQAFKMITCNLIDFSQSLASCINKMTSITVLHLTACSLNSNTMKPIAESLGKSHLVELDLSWNEGLRDSMKLWFSSFQGVKKLVLRSCALTGNDLMHIAVSQKKMPTIVELVLSENTDAFSSVESVLLFCNDLVNLSCLKSLTLGSCAITGESFKCVATALGKIPALTELNLIENAKLGGSAELWSLCLKEMKRMERLDFRCCSLKADDVRRILSSDMLSLLCLKLSGNRSLGGNTQTCNWCSLKRSLTSIEELELKDCDLDRSDFTCLVSLIGSLRRHTRCFFDFRDVQRFLVIAGLSTGVRLDLSKCSLSGQMLNDVLEAISNKQEVIELALGVNEELGGCATVWSKYITDLIKLQHLDLRRCRVLSTDIEALATSASVISTLVELNLSENDALGGCAAEWASHLARLKHMKMLHLSKCSLRSRDVQDMATAFCDVHSLVELDLSINGLLRDTGKLWDCLKDMKQLQNLDLSWCSLIIQDAKCIAETLGCMPALIRLNLRDNCIVEPLASLSTKFHSDSDNVFVRKFIDE